MIPPDLLSQYEAAFFGRLSQADTEQLEQKLQTRPDWQQEMVAYRQLWTGLDTLQREALQQQLRQWDEELAAHDEAELLEWYFSGQLSDANTQHIDQRRETNPAFAARFDQYRTLYGGLVELGDEQFRKQVASWDPPDAKHSAAKIRKLPNRRNLLAIAASVLLLITAGLLLLPNEPNPQALLDELYAYPVTGNTLGADSLGQADYLSSFSDAHQAFQQGDYAQAATTFTQLATAVPPATLSDDDVHYYQDNMEWMVVLARYGAGKTDNDFVLRLRSIADNADHQFQVQAQRLRKAANY